MLMFSCCQFWFLSLIQFGIYPIGSYTLYKDSILPYVNQDFRAKLRSRSARARAYATIHNAVKMEMNIMSHQAAPKSERHVHQHELP